MEGTVKRNPSLDFREFLGFLAERTESCKSGLYQRVRRESIEANFLAEATEKWLVMRGSSPGIHVSEEEIEVVRGLVRKCVNIADETVKAVQQRILDLLRPMHIRGLIWRCGNDWPSELDWELEQEYRMVGFDRNPVPFSREVQR